MPNISGITIDKNKPYNLYWPWNSGTIQNGKTGSTDIFGTSAPNGTKNISDKYLIEWKSKVTSNNSASTTSNAKMTSSKKKIQSKLSSKK